MVRDFRRRPGGALVVGANGGIGSAIAQLLAQRGSALALTYNRNISRIDRAFPGRRDDRIRTYKLDTTDDEACRAVIERAVGELDGLHTLIYAAGPHVQMAHLSQLEPGVLRRQLSDDAGGFINTVLPAIGHLRQSKGNVVAVTTAATGRFPVRDGLSAVPKGAIEALVRGLAVEEGRFGVRANCVGPGMLTDGMANQLISSGALSEQALIVARSNIPLRRFGTARDVAEAACFLASDEAGFVSGQCIRVDGGYSA